MNKKSLLTHLIFSLFAFSTALFADKGVPIDVTAQTVVVNERQGVSIYTGDAQITQGGLWLSGENIQIFNADKVVTKIIAKGVKKQPARYQQEQKSGIKVVEAVKAGAQKLVYLIDKQILHLEGDAYFIQGADAISANVLNYDIKNDKIFAKKSLKDGTQRVKFKIKL